MAAAILLADIAVAHGETEAAWPLVAQYLEPSQSTVDVELVLQGADLALQTGREAEANRLTELATALLSQARPDRYACVRLENLATSYEGSGQPHMAQRLRSLVRVDL